MFLREHLERLQNIIDFFLGLVEPHGFGWVLHS